MGDQYYRFFPGDYHRDTGDLTMLEHGAYRLLLDHYYMQGSLPADRKKLYRLCRAFDQEEQDAIDNVVSRFFQKNGTGLLNKKAEAELEKRRSYLDEQARKSLLGVKARRLKKEEPEEEPTGQPTGQPEGEPLPSPSPSLKEKEEKQKANPMPPPVDNSPPDPPEKKQLYDLFVKISKEYPDTGQLREVQKFIELNRRNGNPKALVYSLNRLLEEKAKGKPPVIIGKWLERVMVEENKNHNARDAEVETAKYKSDFTSIEDIFKGVPR